MQETSRVTLLRALILWGARWTAALGLIGIATQGRADTDWTLLAGAVFALADLFFTMLKEARMADKRARTRDLVRELETRLAEGSARNDR